MFVAEVNSFLIVYAYDAFLEIVENTLKHFLLLNFLVQVFDQFFLVESYHYRNREIKNETAESEY